jgi:hypothetical protein
MLLSLQDALGSEKSLGKLHIVALCTANDSNAALSDIR